MKRQILRSPIFWTALSGALLACGDPVGAGNRNVAFDASPDTIVAGDTVEVEFTLRNPTPYPRKIQSSYGCLFFLETLRDGEPVPWRGTDYVCTAAFTDFDVAPWDSVHVVQEIVAARTDGSGDAVSPGTYRIRARMNTGMDDLETDVTVQAAPATVAR